VGSAGRAAASMASHPLASPRPVTARASAGLLTPVPGKTRSVTATNSGSSPTSTAHPTQPPVLAGRSPGRAATSTAGTKAAAASGAAKDQPAKNPA
jgi:hypothetical protein